MSVQELEQAVARLTTEELDDFAQWFVEFYHSQWDQQILADSEAGRLDALIKKAHEDFEAERCQTI